MLRSFLWIPMVAIAFFAVSACGMGQGKDADTNPSRLCYPVLRVVDGDTLRIRMEGGREEVIRLLGIDTPETVKPNSPVEPYGKEASQFAKDTLLNETVCLEFDVQKRDKYDRLLAYVYLEDGTFVNELLLLEGYAQVLTIPPNVKYAQQFVESQRIARDAGKGLWSGSMPSAQGQSQSDRDCSDFSNRKQAQVFFEAEGGPQRDPHRLDGDGDGIACDSLPLE